MSNAAPFDYFAERRYVPLSKLPEAVEHQFTGFDTMMEPKNPDLAAVRITFEGIDTYMPLLPVVPRLTGAITDLQDGSQMSAYSFVSRRGHVQQLIDATPDGGVIGAGQIQKSGNPRSLEYGVPYVSHSWTDIYTHRGLDELALEARRFRLMAMIAELGFKQVLHSDREGHENPVHELMWDKFVIKGIAEVESRDDDDSHLYRFKPQILPGSPLHAQARANLQ